MALSSWKFIIDNPFGINFRFNMWNDKTTETDFSSIIKYAKENIIEKGLHRSDYISDEEAHWNKYNLFKELDNQCINSVKKDIIRAYKQFCKEMGAKEEKKLWINGFLNIMERGDKLGIHNHGRHDNAYLSGNLCLTDTKHTTNFILPNWEKPTQYHIIKFKNEIGVFNLFPQWVNHYVDTIAEDLRIVLGFDLNTNKAMNYYKKHNKEKKLPIGTSIKLIA